MTVESFVRALPKVALHLEIETATPRETMLMFADQNEIGASVKRFDKWLKLYDDPDFRKPDDLREMLQSWLVYGDDLVRAVYDIGVALSKDNVRYAEISVNPLSFVSNTLTFDSFLEALNDGRDRAERAWGVKMRWIMRVPRAEPRRANEVVRWATSATAKKGGVVGLSLTGHDSSVTLDQFERVFGVADKKGLSRSANLLENDDIDEAIDLLGLQTVMSAWGLVDSPETMALMAEKGIALCVNPMDDLMRGHVRDLGNYPMEGLLAGGMPLVISPIMPTLYKTQLSDLYLQLIEKDLMTLAQVEQAVETAMSQAHLPEDEKESLKMMYEVEHEVLREEHLEAAETEGE